MFKTCLKVSKTMIAADTTYSLRLAENAHDVKGAQRLRYQVFVEELGASGPLVDHENRLECDAFDAHFDHLLLVDNRLDPAGLDHVVGAYRLLPSDRLAQVGRYYSEDEFDLSVLKASGRKMVELGRTCVHRDHRGGASMLLLWSGLAQYVLDREIEVMFGPASFHGVDVQELAQSLSWLHHNHSAPADLQVRAIGPSRADMNLLGPEALDRKAALAGMPPLIKAYLRLGGVVGDGAFIDHPFNTTDVCLLMDTARMSAKHKDFYVRKKG